MATEDKDLVRAVGDLLVDARGALRTMRDDDDTRLREAGEAFTAALGALLKLAEPPADDEPEELTTLRTLQLCAYLRRGAERLSSWTSAQSAALPDDVSGLALQIASLLRRATSGDTSVSDEAAEAEREVAALIERLTTP